MKHSYEAFKNTATELLAANAASTDIKEAKQSLTNEVGYTALAIALQGSAEDKQSLKESVAKAAPFNSLKGIVSKAQSVAFYLLMHEVIVMGDSEVTLEAIQAVPDDAIPSVTINELYKAVQEVNKGDIDALNRSKAIEKQALVQAGELVGQDINKKQFALMPAHKQAACIEEATAIVDTQEAAKSKAKAQESRQEAIARIIAEVVALGAESEVMAAFTSNAAKVA